MIRIIIALTLTACLWIAAQAQFFNPPIYINGNSSYVGPGDIQTTGVFAWFGLRAFSNAVANTGTQKAVNVARASDSHTCDIMIATSGDLGNTANCSTGGDNGQSALSFAGIHGTCTGTTSGTTLSCTGATATPSANDFVSGAGIIGLYVTSCGAFVAGAGSCTLSVAPAANITTPETITFVNPIYAGTFYDQSGNNCTVSITGSLRSGLNPIGLNGLLPILLPGLNATTAFSTMACTTPTIPSYATGVAVRQLGSGDQIIISQYDPGSNANGFTLYFPMAGNTFTLYGGTNLNQTASNSVLHSLQGMLNGASSVNNVDGTEVTGAGGPGGVSDLNGCVGANGGLCNINGFQGSLAETGMWVAGTLPNSTVRTNMCHNMRLYWGTPGSC